MRRPKTSDPRAEMLTAAEVNVNKEARYMSRQAVAGISKTLILGKIVFFSTSEGDAWVLDPEDRLALCLVLRGEKQPYRMVDNDTNFLIEWDVNYRFENGVFTVIDSSGEELAIPGYPVPEIQSAIKTAGFPV